MTANFKINRDKYLTHLSVERQNTLPLILNNRLAKGSIAYNTLFDKVAYTDGIQWRDIDISDYDAFVSTTGEEGTYPSISAAISDGKRSIFVKEGTYVETSPIDLPSGIHIVGEKTRTTILVAVGLTAPFIANNTASGNIETVGTVSISIGGTTVTGVGTVFTRLLVGDTIFLGGSEYIIASITDDFNLTISEVYRGRALSGIKYIALNLKSEIRLSNMTIVNSPILPSTDVGISITQINGIQFTNIIVSGFTNNFLIQLCGIMLFKNISSRSSTLDGIILEDTLLGLIIESEILNCGGSGISLTGNLYKTSNIIFDSCFLGNNGSRGIFIQNGSDIINFTNSIIQYNVSDGVRCDNSTSRILISQCNILGNAYGVNHSGSLNTIVNCIISENNSGGILTGDEALVMGNNISNNTGIGIDIGTDQDNSITENIISGNTLDGIKITGNTQSNTITGNAIFDNGGTGINLSGNAAGDNTISSNAIHHNADSGIIVKSDDNVIVGNRCDGNTSFGVSVEMNASRTIVSANNLRGNGTNFSDAGAGTITTGANITI